MITSLPVADHRPNTLVSARAAAAAALLLLLLAWAASLAPLLLPGRAGASAPPTIAVDQPPSWRDVLVVNASVSDAAIQRQIGLVAWARDGRREQSLLWLVADGRSRRYVLPLGAHPGWGGDVSGLSLSLPPQVGSRLALDEARIVRRPPWALDALLLRAIGPLLPELPPWPATVLLTAALGGAALAILTPFGPLRRRLAIVGVALGVVTGGLTLAAQISMLGVVAATYGPLDERAAMLRTPATLDTTAVNAPLLAAHDALPSGPVLALGYAPGGGTRDRSHVVYLSRSLLAPRRVDALPEELAPQQLARRLADGGYVGLLAARDRGAPPLPGWQRVTAPGAVPTVWRAPDLPAFAAATPGRSAPLRLAAALLLAALVGCGVAGRIGWRGLEWLAAGWALGAVIVGIWLFVLAAAGIPWSALSIGLPLVLAGGATALGLWRASRHAIRRPGRADLAAALAILALTAIVGAQATLMPFTDQDTWTNWGLKGRAFFYDEALAPVMRAYHQYELYHMGYPPAQPLLQTYGYLALGGVSERLIKSIFPIWYGACLLLLFAGCRRWLSARAALGWTLLLGLAPVMLDHATLANADLPLATLWLLAALALVRWVERGERRWLIAGASALAAAAWVKIDGLYFGPAMVGAATLARLWAARGPDRRRLPTLAAGVGAAGAVALAVAPWSLYVRTLDLRGELPSVELLAREGGAIAALSVRLMVEQLLFSHSNSGWGLLGSGYGAFWLICGGALVLGARRLRDDPALGFLVLTVLGGVLFYVAIYTVEPFISHDRYLLHLAPIAALMAARSRRRDGADADVPTLATRG